MWSGSLDVKCIVFRRECTKLHHVQIQRIKLNVVPCWITCHVKFNGNYNNLKSVRWSSWKMIQSIGDGTSIGAIKFNWKATRMEWFYSTFLNLQFFSHSLLCLYQSLLYLIYFSLPLFVSSRSSNCDNVNTWTFQFSQLLLMQYEHVETEFHLIKLLHETHERSIICLHLRWSMRAAQPWMHSFRFIIYFFATKSFNFLKQRRKIQVKKKLERMIPKHGVKDQSVAAKCATEPGWKIECGIFIELLLMMIFVECFSFVEINLKQKPPSIHHKKCDCLFVVFVIIQ